MTATVPRQRPAPDWQRFPAPRAPWCECCPDGAFLCPVCQSVSHNPHDQRFGYCARCTRYTRYDGPAHLQPVLDAAASGRPAHHG